MMYKREGEQLPITIPIDWYKELEAKIKELESFNKHLGLLNKENLTFICKQKTDIAELTAKLDKAREALERIVNGDVWVETEYSIAKTALEELDK